MAAVKGVTLNRRLRQLLSAFALLNIAEWGMVTTVAIHLYRVSGVMTFVFIACLIVVFAAVGGALVVVDRRAAQTLPSDTNDGAMAQTATPQALPPVPQANTTASATVTNVAASSCSHSPLRLAMIHAASGRNSATSSGTAWGRTPSSSNATTTGATIQRYPSVIFIRKRPDV